jgi:hypothetical protein
MKIYIFWVIMPCSPLKINLRFGETCRLHLQGQKVIQAKMQHEAISKQTSADLLLGLFFDPDNGGEMILRNVG